MLAHRITNENNYNESCVLSESPPPFYTNLLPHQCQWRYIMKHLWAPVWWMDGNGAVTVCSCFCLNAQLDGNQNVAVVGTSYRITWLFPHSWLGEGRKSEAKGNIKGFPAFWNLCTIKPFHRLWLCPLICLGDASEDTVIQVNCAAAHVTVIQVAQNFWSSVGEP